MDCQPPDPSSLEAIGVVLAFYGIMRLLEEAVRFLWRVAKHSDL